MLHPAITLSEWAERNSTPEREIKERTARKWCLPGQPLHGRAWQSAGIWLIRPDEPVPAIRTAGRPRAATRPTAPRSAC